MTDIEFIIPETATPAEIVEVMRRVVTETTNDAMTRFTGSAAHYPSKEYAQAVINGLAETGAGLVALAEGIIALAKRFPTGWEDNPARMRSNPPETTAASPQPLDDLR